MNDIEKFLTENWKKFCIGAASFTLMAVILNATVYQIEEGHVGIVKTWGKAVEQVDPGIHAKWPIAQSIVSLEIRTRKNQEKMQSSTHEQMPVTASVSTNWTVNKSAALDLYKKYGGLDQFESRILDTRFRSATKDVIPHYTAEQLIQDRSAATSGIQGKLVKLMDEFPVKVDSIQIENIILPPKYIKSIEVKQTEKNLAAAEEHKLAKQAFTAQQAVNTANADRDSKKARADGDAYAVKVNADAKAHEIKVQGLAEADAIKAKAKALQNNPLIVELTKAQNWNGSYLTTGIGDGAKPLVMLESAQSK